MKSKMFFSWNIIVLALFLSYSVDKAVALKCYECSSDNDPDCESKPVQKKFEYECLNINPKLSPGDIISHTTDGGITLNPELQCIKFKISKGSEIITTRRCLSKSNTCQKLNILPDQTNLKSCELCDTDLCNSSMNLNAGFWVLSISVMIIMFSK